MNSRNYTKYFIQIYEYRKSPQKPLRISCQSVLISCKISGPFYAKFREKYMKFEEKNEEFEGNMTGLRRLIK
jgi:hypothetical protein